MSSFLTNIIKFIEVLRLSGVRVSISESIDAFEALKFVDITDRAQVKTAFSACLAKSQQEKFIFSKAFDRYFINYDEKAAFVKDALEKNENRRKDTVEKVSELKFKEAEIEIEEEFQEIYASLPEDERQSIRDFLDKTSSGKNVKPEFKTIVETMVRGKLYNIRQKYPQLQNSKPKGHNGFDSQAGIIADSVLEDVKSDNELLYKDIGEIEDSDIPKVVRLIRIMAERLKGNITRKYKSTNKKVRLDFKKTIQSNLATGSIQFKLKYKKRPRRKDKLLLLCDVSASMYQFSGFVLQFITGIHSGVLAADSYIFSQEIEHLNVSSFINASTFSQKITNSSVWKKGTNINKALEFVLKEAPLILNSSTIVLIVSDAKTLDADKTLESLKKLDNKVKKILWLNPIKEKDWTRIAGIEGYKKYSKMLDCSNIERLCFACESI